jgi:RNA polymerase sigma-70 factor (ECF subfamily)
MFEEMDEAQLIERAKTDPEAFGQLYELYVEKIYNYIYYRLGNHHDAEDLTAKVFYRALNHIAHYNNKGAPFAAWLYRIAHNLVVNWRRDQSRRQTVGLEDVDLAASDRQDSPQHAAEQADERELLLAAMQRLPRERQELLVMKFVERMSNAEIGQVLGRSEGAIKSLYHRTLVSLKEILTEHENLVKEAKTVAEEESSAVDSLELKELGEPSTK